MAILAVLISAGMWWVYFDNLDGTVVRRRAGQTKAWKPTAWIYGHLPLVVALIVTSVGLEHAIIAVEHHGLKSAERWLLVGGVAGVFAALALLQAATEPVNAGSAPGLRREWMMGLRLAGSGLAVVAGFVFGGSVWLLVVTLTAVCALQVAGDVIITERVKLQDPDALAVGNQD
jgi:low temperature requirement protein LtrA